MITPYQSYPILIAYFKRQKKQECFNRMKSSVHKVSHEYIVGLGAITTDLEKLHQIVKLSMDISANRDRWINILDIWFFHQYVPCYVAQITHFWLFDTFALFQKSNLFVQVGKLAWTQVTTRTRPLHLNEGLSLMKLVITNTARPFIWVLVYSIFCCHLVIYLLVLMVECIWAIVIWGSWCVRFGIIWWWSVSWIGFFSRYLRY